MSNQSRSMCCFQVLLSLVIALAGEGKGQNLLVNPSFEQSNPFYRSVPLGWSSGSFPPGWWELTSRNGWVHTGRRALILERSTLSQPVNVKAKQRYTVGVWAKALFTRNVGEQVNLRIGVAGTFIDWALDRSLDTGWKFCQDTFTPAKDGTVAVRIGIWPNGGIVDDAVLVVGTRELSTTQPNVPFGGLDIGFDPFLSANIYASLQNSIAELDKALAGDIRSLTVERLTKWADDLYRLRDDSRAWQCYDHLQKMEIHDPEINQRWKTLNAVLAERVNFKKRTAFVSGNFPELLNEPDPQVACDRRKFYAGETDQTSSPLEVTLDQVYYYPWESRAYLSVQTRIAQKINVRIEDQLTAKIFDRGPFLLSVGINTFALDLIGLQVMSQPMKRYRVAITVEDRILQVSTIDFGIIDFTPHPLDPIKTVRIRNDGTLLVNETPFFPLGIWDSICHNWLFDRMEDIAATGFNLGPALMGGSHCTGTRTLPYLYYPSGPKAPMSETDAKVLEMPTNWQYDPGILFWHWWDEPFFMLEPKFKPQYGRIVEIYKTLRRFEPFKPILINGMWDSDNYLPFCNEGDILASEPYDIGIHGISLYLQGPEKAIAAARAQGIKHPFAVWSIPGLWRRPTPDLVRAEAYAAILAGAKGLYWYAYDTADGAPRQPAFVEDYLKWGSVNCLPLHAPRTWSAMRGLTRELKTIEKFILSAQPPVEIPTDPPGLIQAKLYSYGQEKLLIAADISRVTLLGNWQWKIAGTKEVHTGTWSKPKSLPRFFAFDDLPHSPPKFTHGIVWLEPVTLEPGDVIHQEVFPAGSKGRFQMMPVVNRITGRFWVHPKIKFQKEWNVDDSFFVKTGHQLSVDLHDHRLVGRQLVGMYFSSDNSEFGWGDTVIQKACGSQKIWINRSVVEMATVFEKNTRLSVSIPIANPLASDLNRWEVLFEPRKVPHDSYGILDAFRYGEIHVYHFKNPPAKSVRNE